MHEATIEGQLALEQTMVDRGAALYLKNQRKAEEKGRGADLDYSRRLMQEFMEPLIVALEAEINKKGAAQYGRARTLLRRVDPAAAMFIAMRAMFNAFGSEAEQVVQTVTKIGKVIEDEIRFKKFKDEFGDYYDTIIQDFKRKGTSDYRYMQRVLTHSANELDDMWISWSQAERADVGARLLDIILENTDLCEKQTWYDNKGKTRVRLSPTAEAKKWIDEHEAIQQFLYPDRTPCIIEPDQWSGMYQGGYYTPRMRSVTPLVKASGSRQKKLLERANLTNVMAAVNAVQNTPWAVNTDVLQIVKEAWAKNLGIGMPSSQPLVVPPSPFPDAENLTEAEQARFTEWKHEASEVYTNERDRISKGFQVTRIIRIANDYAEYNKFWFVWYADFRGRLYTATASYSPQGPDLAKGLLRFGNGKPLGERGYYWLKVHLANRYGYDKVSYGDRVKWADDKRADFLACAADPLSNRDVWVNADKPWQFLAAIFEYAKVEQAIELGMDPSAVVSYLPIGLDGSCNGLQNFSAMLRDPVGGAATNLVPNSVPADIYTKVGEVCLAHIKEMHTGNPLVEQWIAWADKHGKGKFPRSLPKRPVMTLPYGATQQSCTKYIFQHILEYDKNHFPGGAFKAACWLTPILWKSIGEVVVAARDAMAWLQKAAGCMSKYNKPCTWQVADGFIATQHSRELTTKQVETQLQGRFQIRIGTYNDNINKYKQRSGIAPNFIHSQDALHLRTTVRLASARGISNLACIHDDYGTHACDTDMLHKCIRDAFVVLYSKGDPLASFKAQQEATGTQLPPLPLKGDLDIERVRDSEYFFG